MRIPFINIQLHLGKFVAPLAAAIPKSAVLPIFQGPARGIRWRVGSGMQNFWLGTYEREKYEHFSEEISPGMVVYDIGANTGIYTVLACRRVGKNGRVIAFEPATMNLFYLKENVRLNRFANCEVIPKAVSDIEGTVAFESNGESCLGKIVSDGLLRVPSTTLDSFVAAGNAKPNLIKIDVEGAEYQVLIGAKRLLPQAKPIIYLATHGEKVHGTCCDLLERLGYELELLAPDEIIARHPII